MLTNLKYRRAVLFVVYTFITCCWGDYTRFPANSTSSRAARLILLHGNGEHDSTSSRSDENNINEGTCALETSCIPISSCPLLYDLLDRSCLGSDNYFRRLNALTCGYTNNEAMVCCPPGGYFGISKPNDDKDGKCGEVMVRGMMYEGLGSQPWVARIGFKSQVNGRFRYPCSGSIIGRRVILTAAHCALAKAEGYKLNSVLVGEYDADSERDCNKMFCSEQPQRIAISHLIVHPGYEKKMYRHDIALVILSEDISYTVTSLPLCIIEQYDEPVAVNRRATLVGWGKLAGQETQPSAQQQLDVPVLALEACERVYGDVVPVRSSQLCAGGEAGRDACSGFGGSPLITLISGKYTQIGIVSFGSESCGSPGVPSVYTNVKHYAKWIKENSPTETEPQ